MQVKIKLSGLPFEVPKVLSCPKGWPLPPFLTKMKQTEQRTQTAHRSTMAPPTTPTPSVVATAATTTTATTATTTMPTSLAWAAKVLLGKRNVKLLKTKNGHPPDSVRPTQQVVHVVVAQQNVQKVPRRITKKCLTAVWLGKILF